MWSTPTRRSVRLSSDDLRPGRQHADVWPAQRQNQSLAAAIGLALMENGWRALFTRTTDLVRKFSDGPVGSKGLTLPWGGVGPSVTQELQHCPVPVTAGSHIASFVDADNIGRGLWYGRQLHPPADIQ